MNHAQSVGSTVHPHIAQKREGVFSKEKLDKLNEKVEKSKKLKENYQKDIIELKANIDSKIEELGIRIEELEQYQTKIQKEYKEKQEKNEKHIININQIYSSISKGKIDLEKFDYNKFKEQNEKEEKEIENRISKSKGQLEENEKALKEKKEAIKLLINDYELSFKELGFQTEKEYKEAVYTEKEIEIKQKLISELENKIQENKTRLKDLADTVKELEKVDLTNNKKEIEAIKAELLGKRNKQMEFNNIKTQNKEIYQKLKENEKILKNAIENYLALEELENTANGKLSGKKRIKFEQYVQAAYFEMIIGEANKRLAKMTENRFYLLRREEAQNLSEKPALELDVMDNYNGKRRDVKSLSGGEAFKAALSLALGLSDVIQSYSGGVVVDTLFIDEGFGSLDSESREQAISTLIQLSDNNKLIGIISHVSELKEILDKKIIVSKTTQGSKVEMEV